MITIFSIAFNGYGKYVEQFLDHIKEQEVKPKDVILILGKNHNTPKDILKRAEKETTLIFENEDRTMGYLYNLAIDKCKTDWIFRFDIDDVLLPNAIKELKEAIKDNDVVSVLFGVDSKKRPTNNVYGTHLSKDFTKGNVVGYVANKIRINNELIKYEDNDAPNFPQVFLLNFYNVKWGYTKNKCVIYKIHEESHSKQTTARKKAEFKKIISNARERYKKDITVFTIVYNGYGRFIPQWVNYLNKQTIKAEILIVLGNDHGADTKWLQDNNIPYIEANSTNMGVLRNNGLKHIKTNWWLYFSVDDELLPHACEEIVNTNADAVSLIFNAIEENGEIKSRQLSPCFNNTTDLNGWVNMWGGYVAVRGNRDLRFREDIEVPNISLHFDMFKRKLKVARSKTVLANHLRWNNSHHFVSQRNGSRKESKYKIKEQLKEILQERGIKMVKVRALDTYEKGKVKDNQLKRVPKEGEEFEVNELRLEVLLGNNKYNKAFVEVIEEEIKEEKKEIIIPIKVEEILKKKPTKKSTIKKRLKKK